MRRLFNIALVALPPGALFLAQTWLMATGRGEAVLALAKFGGLLSLIFFAFDGSSGLLPALMRLRHAAEAIRLAYLVYRGGIILLLLAALPLAWHFARIDTQDLLPFLAASLLLRLPLLDIGLDQRGWQHWSMLLQNGWMPPLAAIATLSGGVDAVAAGHAALWGTLVLFAAHLALVRPPGHLPERAKFRPALSEIVSYMGAQGIGQLYGRAVLFALGASFTGPLPALAVYAKQAFNAAGLLTAYLRRVELAHHHPNMQLSLGGQAATALVASLLLAFAATNLGVMPGLVLALIAWQALEKLSANAVYAFQLGNRHGLAVSSLLTVAGVGLIGLALAVAWGKVLIFVATEALLYCFVLLFWLRAQQGLLRPGRSAGP